jgi:bacterioferritin
MGLVIRGGRTKVRPPFVLSAALLRRIRIGIRKTEIAVRLNYHAAPDNVRIQGNAMTDSPLETKLTKKVIDSLNRILELELAGVVRYMHYSFMIFGHNRIPIVAWLRDQSNESNAHAILAGEHITAFGGHPSLKIGALLETHKHDVNEILKEAYKHEKEGLDEYHVLLGLVAGQSVLLEEYARDQIAAEEMHLADIRKMMRKPGSIKY